MKRFGFLFMLATMLFTLTQSCLDEVTSASGGGREGEVVVVLEDKFKESAAGKELDSVLRAPYPGLPQYEPMFKLYVIPWESFTNTFRSFRNIVKVKISSSVSKPGVTVKRAKAQVVFNFKAKTEKEFVELLRKNKDQLINLLNYSEKKNAEYKIMQGIDKPLQKYMLNRHQLKTYIPKGYQVRLDTNNFVWLSLETNKMSSGIFIYTYPYTDSSTFTKDYLLHKRDSLLKLYVMGPLAEKKETYMTTQYEYIPPVFKELMVEGKYYTEIRGLWHVVNDFMGGPFINITRLDQVVNRIVTFEGYVYYPNEDKRKHVRWLESIGYATKFPEEDPDAKNKE